MRFETRDDLLDLFDMIEYYSSTIGFNGDDIGYEILDALKEAVDSLALYDNGEATSRDVASHIDDLLKEVRLSTLSYMIEH